MASAVPTLEGLPEEALGELKMALHGHALLPGDPGYESVRPPYNAMHPDEPSLVVSCTGTADVVDAVNFGREHGMEVTVRGGGHSIAGLSAANGGLLIDLAPMNGVWTDREGKLVHAQGGALWSDVDRETQLYGLATPGGMISDTGVAGLTLGGGVGWLRRKHGLSCDNVVAAQVVLANGEVVTASADEHPELLWALKGGGGNFGIVTSFTFSLHAVGPIVAFAGLFYPVGDAASILRGFRDYVESSADEVTPVALPLTMPADPHLPEAIHNQDTLIVGGVFAGDAEEGMGVLQPLRELGTPLADISQPMPYRMVQSAFDAFFPRQQVNSYWKSTYVPELSDALIDLAATKMQDRPAPLADVIVWPMGGQVNRVGEDESAYGERSAPYMISVEANWSEGDAESMIGWARETWSQISEFGTGTLYLNFTGLSDEATETGVDAAFGSTLQRLAKIKAHYDPDNFFHRNNNIAPAA
jgi:FAD/FMN-containing dehydrogenase